MLRVATVLRTKAKTKLEPTTTVRGKFFQSFFQCDGSTAARTRFTAGGVPLDDSSAGGGWDLLDDSPVLSLSPLLSLSLDDSLVVPKLFSSSLSGSFLVSTCVMNTSGGTVAGVSGSDAQYVARHVGIVREIHDATRCRVATFARQTLSFHKITNATPIGRKPTATFVRKMGATENGHAAVFEVQFGKQTDRATEASSERSAEQLFHDSVCCVSCAATSVHLRIALSRQ